MAQNGEEVVTSNMYNMYNTFVPNLVQIRAQDNWFSQQPSCATTTEESSQIPQGEEVPCQEDTFGLEFAAIQWLNLVTNAEELFNKLLTSNIVLSSDEKNQIQRWLCLKQECEECVATEEEQQRQSLERIEELTENTGESSSFEKSSDSQYESETESDFDSRYPDFEDKLDGYMERFKDKTDALVRMKLENNECEDEALDTAPYGAACNSGYLQGRRKSLHPGSILILPSFAQSREHESRLQPSSAELGPDEGPVAMGESLYESEPFKQLKILSSGNDAKKTQIKQVVIDLEGAQKRMEELQHTIQIKEQFVRDMIKNSETRNNAKLRFQRKWTRTEEEYYKTRTQLAQAESALQQVKVLGAQESLSSHRNQVDRYKTLARHYEKRLKDIDSMKQIAGDSAKKVLELENSLQCSKKQLEKLKKQLRTEESYKHKLEQELEEDQQRMKDLQEKYNLHMSTMLERQKETKNDGDRMKWIAEETERLNVMRESSQRLHHQLQQQQGMLDKREAFLKEKFCLEKQRNQNLMEVSERITHLESILKEKALSFEKSDEKDEKEQLRQEIHNLRKTRDHLLEQRSNLDQKYHKDQGLSSTEERTYLECAEAIEAIDAAIEYKNELICGRKALGSDSDLEREHGEQLLMERLLKLSSDELRTLLYKYFQKVIDLRESGRRMEEQVDEAEQQAEVQAWKLQEVNQVLQSERLETEKRFVLLQREHQEKVHLMLRHFAEESGSSGTEAGCRLPVPSRDSEISKLKRENKALRRKLQEMEGLVSTTAVAGREVTYSAGPAPRPLKPLPAPPPTTKVTREKNKVIIRLNTQKKESSSGSSSKKKDVISFNYRK